MPRVSSSVVAVCAMAACAMLGANAQVAPLIGTWTQMDQTGAVVWPPVRSQPTLFAERPGFLLLFGGWGSCNCFVRDFYRYSIADNRWTLGQTSPAHGAGYGAFGTYYAAKDTSYLIGGGAANVSYIPGGANTTALQVGVTLPAANYGVACTTMAPKHPEMVYCFGGETFTNVFWTLSLETWVSALISTATGTVPVPRRWSHMAPAHGGDSLLLFGGHAGYNLNDVHLYSSITNSWTDISSRFAAAASPLQADIEEGIFFQLASGTKLAGFGLIAQAKDQPLYWMCEDGSNVLGNQTGTKPLANRAGQRAFVPATTGTFGELWTFGGVISPGYQNGLHRLVLASDGPPCTVASTTGGASGAASSATTTGTASSATTTGTASSAATTVSVSSTSADAGSEPSDAGHLQVSVCIVTLLSVLTVA